MNIIKPTIELLAAIPSVVYGFIGVMVLAPIIRENFGGPGLSLLSASIILGIMILPTVISISIDSILAVPQSYREGSLALGATTWQTIHMVTVKASKIRNHSKYYSRYGTRNRRNNGSYHGGG